MKVNEIFFSLDGEGKRVGQPTVFIRRSGCNLHCLYDGKDCDTPYRDEGAEMAVDEILDKVCSYHCKNITLTGGEPLLPSVEMDELRKKLSLMRFDVNIETNGTMSTEIRYGNEFFTVDYKCGCSGMTDRMNPEAFRHLRYIDVVKFVVAESDFEQVRQKIQELVENWKSKLNPVDTPFIYISPCFGRCDLQKLAEFVKSLYSIYSRVGLSLQTHKIIWSPEQRGV